jgi:hypothetical protein
VIFSLTRINLNKIQATAAVRNPGTSIMMSQIEFPKAITYISDFLIEAFPRENNQRRVYTLYTHLRNKYNELKYI